MALYLWVLNAINNGATEWCFSTSSFYSIESKQKDRLHGIASLVIGVSWEC